MSSKPKNVVLWNTSPMSAGLKAIAQINIFRTLGAYKIAHALRSADYQVQVIDFVTWFTEDQLFEATAKFIDHNTSCIAISTTFMLDTINNTTLSPTLIAVLNRLTDEFPNLKLVFGGYGIGVLKRQLSGLNKKKVAFISQYGEDIMVDLVNYYHKRSKSPAFQLDQVGDTSVYTYSMPLEERYNIQTDNFKFHDDDGIQPNETLPIEISRGCIFKCKFCNHLLLGRGKLDYLRDFEIVKEELIHNYTKWGITNYYVICDTFNDTEYKMQEWHRMVTSLPFKIKYTVYLRADLLDRFPDVPYMLEETGLLSCFHGIETLGVNGSSVIGKGWSGKSAREYIPKLYHDIWGKRVHQTISLIAGLPGDTREILTDTAQWFVDNDLYNVNWHTLGISPDASAKNASEFERNSEKYGYVFNTDKSKPYKWKTDYWTDQEAGIFVKDVLTPMTAPSNAMYGSWPILQMMQYGVDEKWFSKSKSKSLAVFYNLETIARNWIVRYRNTIMEM